MSADNPQPNAKIERSRPRRQRNSYFQCRQFRIDQTDAAMKVTTDACLLGAWAEIGNTKRILDIGTGSGLLALFAAQRSDANIDAIELDPHSAQQALNNFKASPWADRLRLIQGDITQFTAMDGYDVILCNPPFFSDSTPNPNPKLAMARHDDTLSLDKLLTVCSRLLTDRGIAYLLLPITAARTVETRLEDNSLNLVKRLSVCSQPGDSPHRQILALSFLATPCVDQQIVLYRQHPIHTAEAGKLFAPYYTRLRCEDPYYATE